MGKIDFPQFSPRYTEPRLFSCHLLSGLTSKKKRKTKLKETKKTGKKEEKTTTKITTIDNSFKETNQ